MKKHAISFEAGLERLDQVRWRARALEIGSALGHSKELGDDYIAVHLEAGPNLFVTFESTNAIRRRSDDAEPLGFSYTRRDGWSTLTIVGQGNAHFRDPAIYDYIDGLTDDGFFDGFDNILFYGEAAGAYAACAYSVAAPGSRVLAFSPYSTLTPSLAKFDPRSTKVKQVDFTSRYGFAPAMLDAAKDAYIVFNPDRRLEAIHATIFKRDHTVLLPAFGCPANLETTFEELDILEDLIRAAMAGTLSSVVFADQYRARREHGPYLTDLIKRAIASGHTDLARKAHSVAMSLNDDEDLAGLYNELNASVSDLENVQIH